jgi:hypothetical protein
MELEQLIIGKVGFLELSNIITQSVTA